MIKSNKLIVISAPSGAGKTSLCQRLLEDFPRLKLSISSTTRAPRGSETDGREYHFLTREEFEKGIAENRFAEWATVHGNYYGTSKSTIEAAFSANLSVLLDIDVQGAESLRQAYPTQAVRIFIAPPSMKALEERLRARKTDSEDTILKRLKNAEKEMRESARFDHVVVNDRFEDAYRELKQKVEAALG